MEALSVEVVGLLFLCGIIAGWIDSIAGGGGLITLPVFLNFGLTPAQALATNKLQGCFGTGAATLNYFKKGHYDLKKIWPMIVMTFIGAGAGTLLIQSLDASFLIDVIPFLLVAIGAYFLFQPQIGQVESHQRLSLWGFSFTIGFGIGFYDGFFGPGTGSFFALAFIVFQGFNILKATAHTKILNFTSNIASLLFFAFGGQIIWTFGFIMALGQIIGAYIGSHMSMKHGTKIIRPLLVLMSFAMTTKIIISTPDHFIHQWVLQLFN